MSNGSARPAIASSDAARALVRRARPAAILALSAHWRTDAPTATASRHPLTLHDGAPAELGHVTYACPGWPMLAQRVVERLGGVVDRDRGLDHGVWGPLHHLVPNADVPVVQVGIPALAPAARLVDLGRQLASFRAEGIWILGSGDIVCNRARLAGEGSPPPDWARAFDDWVAARVAALDLSHLGDWRRHAPYASLALPTPELIDPLFVVLGTALPDDRVVTVAEGFERGTISRRSFLLSDEPIRG